MYKVYWTVEPVYPNLTLLIVFVLSDGQSVGLLLQYFLLTVTVFPTYCYSISYLLLQYFPLTVTVFPTYRIGRKKTLLIGILFQLASILALAWSQNYLMYVLLRFCTGAAVVGVFMTTYVLGRDFTSLVSDFLLWVDFIVSGIPSVSSRQAAIRKELSLNWP